MTSTASQQNPIPAPNPTNIPVTSYASAAGSSKKPSTTPVIATGSNPPGPPVVVGSAQNGKPTPSAVNGRPNITPAIPAAPAVARGTPNINGGASHDRKSSVTIPPKNTQNGGAISKPQFGFTESPAAAHSTPQPHGSAPIPIPGNSARIPSPASPAPIPQHSGGQQRPSSNVGNLPTFGSFPGEGDRQMKSNIPQNHVPMGSPQIGQNLPHYRTNSQASNHGGEMPQHNHRGGYGGGRGRGGYNPNNSYQGYPPQRPYNGPNGGRGGGNMYGGRGGMGFPNSPQRPHASPATTPAMPHATPNMPPAGLAQPPYYQGPPMGYGHQAPMNPQYTMDQYGRPIMYPGYPQQPVPPYMAPPPQGAPGFHQQFAAPPFSQAPPAAQPMSRNPSQVSDRPASSTGPNQVPPVPQSAPTPQPRPAQTNPPVVSGSANFVRAPKKSAAIVIKNSAGDVVDINSIAKAPASPAPSVQSKTPPVVSSSPPPPPKPSTTPSHVRTDSSATKTAEQLRNEFKDAVADAKAREEEAAKLAAEKAEKAELEKAQEAQRLKDEEARKEAERIEAEKKAKAEEEAKAAKAAEDAAKAAKAAQEAADKEKAEAEAKAKAEAEAEASKKKQEETDEDEMERIIREMEEEDARREQEQAAISAKKAAEKAEQKKKDDANRAAHAAENDRKLREQEAEMERLEEEREKKRKENEAKGKTEPSVSDLLAKKIEDLSKPESTPPTPSSISDKLAAMSIDGAPSAGGKGASAAEKHRAKPAALNLAPLNTKQVEAPQPSAAIQSLKSARFLTILEPGIYPEGIRSPNPALNAAVSTKGKSFKYDAAFLLQFQKVFTEQPSVEFHQQVKSLLGDTEARSARTPGGGGPNRVNSRPSAAAAFPGNQFGQFGAGARPIPPGSGLNSDQRFAMSSGALPRPNVGGPAMSFGRGGFPGPAQMSRTPSSTNMGGIPNSPRTGSRRGSKRPDHSKAASVKDDKAMPLTQGMDLKPITTSSSGWKPQSLGRSQSAAGAGAGANQSAHMDPEMVQRKVKANLNKMTPEKFDKIADQILAIASQSKNEQDGRTLRQVIQLTFEKATDESHWASMYAKFCKRMLETMSPEIRDENILDKNGQVVSGGALFRKYLLNRCQEEFERGWKVDLPEPKEGEDKKAQEAALMSDEYYIAAAAKRRGLGLVQFIGELYKLGMLTERIMHECVRKLLEFTGIPDEAEIESLTKLLRTIGANLDNTEKGHPMMDVYFQRIMSIIDLPELPSRLKFMLMDVVDLRRANWVDAREVNKGPKTLEEVRADAEAQAAQKAAENARTSQRGPPGGRPAAGRGDARNFSYSNAAPNQVQMDDLRRLKGTGASRSSSQNVSFGPTSMFNSRSNSGRRLAAFGRGGEDSGASSRTGTPPTRESQSIAHTNAFGALADTGDHPGSPPSTAASPALAKAVLDDKKE